MGCSYRFNAQSDTSTLCSQTDQESLKIESNVYKCIVKLQEHEPIWRSEGALVIAHTPFSQSARFHVRSPKLLTAKKGVGKHLT